jgi:hypothetical protein
MTLVQVVAVAVILGLGAYFGRMVAQRSLGAQKIHGGSTAEMFHFAASVLFVMIAPSILVAAFVFHLGLGAFFWGVSLFGIIFLCLIGYAYYELPARANVKREEDKGWTAEDARTSGL